MLINGTRHKGAIDEFIWPLGLRERGLAMHSHGLTYAVWPSASARANRTAEGLGAHGPRAYFTAAEVRSAATHATAGGHFFIRKCAYNDDVQAALRELCDHVWWPGG